MRAALSGDEQPPELLSVATGSQFEPTPATDLWCYGVMLYAAVTEGKGRLFLDESRSVRLLADPAAHPLLDHDVRCYVGFSYSLSSADGVGLCAGAGGPPQCAVR